MSLAITFTRATLGVHAPLVTVEAHLSNGMPKFNIVGLPETVVKESKDRVRSAILNCRFEFPLRRITVNLAPAEIPKHGCRYDLAITLGILAASKQIPAAALHEYEFAGELALSGEIRPIQGVLPLALAAKQAHRTFILPIENVEEAGLIPELKLMTARTLLEVCHHFLGEKSLPQSIPKKITPKTATLQDFREVKGQHQAKRALEIAAAGSHSLLMIGPPGVGKTMLSHCLTGILPCLTESEAIELAAIQSISGKQIDVDTWCQRPFRAPHHSASNYGLLGGGNPPMPGEISLAHHGILFLDELPEFKRQTLEALREPLESGFISHSRAKHQIQYPSQFQLIAAMNPCPCGHHGSNQMDCRCSPEQIKKYQMRISGPLLDRIDIQLALQPPPPSLLTDVSLHIESSQDVAERVLRAKKMQQERVGKQNALLTNEDIRQTCQLSGEDLLFIEQLLTQKKISARAYQKILKISRTIADLDGSSQITRQHIKEAYAYRYFDGLKMHESC